MNGDKPNGHLAEISRERKREWNRGPLNDIFPRIPTHALERVLDICIEKGFTYNLSQPKRWNSRRYTSIVIAHVRHNHTDYDKLLREERVERYAARQRTSKQVWKVLREWCKFTKCNSPEFDTGAVDIGFLCRGQDAC